MVEPKDEPCIDEEVRDTFMFGELDLTELADRKKAGGAIKWLVTRQEAAANRLVRRGTILTGVLSGSLLALIVWTLQHFLLPAFVK